jgi:prepilin-type N-terminal cleavage/methylation domain-containing protein
MSVVRATRNPRLALRRRQGVTLVELLVVIVLISVLAAMALAGMAVARRRVRADRTRNTIRKIHEIVMPQYESFLSRRVPLLSTGNATGNARARLAAIRQLMVWEMPDSWGDVPDNPNAVMTGSNALPFFCRTGPVLSYAATKNALGASVAARNWNAECLYLIVSRGWSDAEALENFRADEIGDTDGDGALEFLDAWNRPIGFIRWAPGASSPLGAGVAGVNSPVQIGDPIRFHDPLDPMQVDTNAFAMTPLIFSSGPDGVSGLVTTGNGGWTTYANSVTSSANPLDGRSVTLSTSTNGLLVTGGSSSVTGTSVRFNQVSGVFTITGSTTVGMRDASAATAWADNITNHDLITK